MSEHTNKTYRFSTFQELFDVVPSDRIEVCMGEMGKAFASAKAIWEMTKAVAEVMAEKDGVKLPEIDSTIPDVHEWIDDGNENVSADITLNGKHFLSINHKKTPPRPNTEPGNK
jgi:hypothetical protein